MDFGKVIREMMKESGISAAALSRALGKSNTFVATTLSKRSTPRMDTFVLMAEAMGYEVVVRKKKKAEIVLGPSAMEDRA